uniref:Serine aminopeptidase S33 domain-containing protein n=1 Tax=Chlamydomonas euryale TaxID=1486919 RepID=A0A7R9W232_9CHLO|mmetsp:Transcript_9541/g.28940  ORF Transcript_9541/g.28940 Transcript_9541/m.28940 type:complete len:301 (+) Transcript_9541:47-949(+)
MGWSSWLIRIGSGIGGLLGVAIAALFIFQEKIVYVPIVPGMPADYWLEAKKYGLEEEDVEITASDGVKLHGWFLHLPHWTSEYMKTRPVVLFFQENAGNMSFRLPFLRGMIKALDCPVFAVSYRGYGKSQGRPNEKGIKLDAEAGLQHLLTRTDVDTSRVFVFGRSLGGAVAMHLVSKHQSQVCGLILENTFTCVEDMAAQLIPPLGMFIGTGRPLNFLVTNKWSSIKILPAITKVPLLMLVSGKDEMVPPQQMYQLHQAQRAPSCDIFEFPDAHHMDAYDTNPAAYWGALTDFVQKFGG